MKVLYLFEFFIGETRKVSTVCSLMVDDLNVSDVPRVWTPVEGGLIAWCASCEEI